MKEHQQIVGKSPKFKYRKKFFNELLLICQRFKGVQDNEKIEPNAKYLRSEQHERLITYF